MFVFLTDITLKNVYALLICACDMLGPFFQKTAFVCLGYVELSYVSVRVSDVMEPWNGNDYVECGFRNDSGTGVGRSFTIECEDKPHARYVAILRTYGESSGRLLFCEAVIMGHKITGEHTNEDNS